MQTSFDTTRGGTRLLFDSVEGIATTVERMHARIASTALPWPVRRKQFTPTRGPEADEFTMTWDRSVQTDYALSLGTGLDSLFLFRNLLSIDAPDDFAFTVSGVTFPRFFGYLAEVDYSLIPNAPTELTAAGNSLIITDRGGVSVTLVFDGTDGGTWSDSRGRSGTLSAVAWTDRLPDTGTVTRDPSPPFPLPPQRTAAIELPLGILQATFSRPAGRDNWLELGVNVSFHEETSGFVEGGANDRDGLGVAVNQAFQFVPAGG